MAFSNSLAPGALFSSFSASSNADMIMEGMSRDANNSVLCEITPMRIAAHKPQVETRQKNNLKIVAQSVVGDSFCPRAGSGNLQVPPASLRRLLYVNIPKKYNAPRTKIKEMGCKNTGREKPAHHRKGNMHKVTAEGVLSAQEKRHTLHGSIGKAACDHQSVFLCTS